MLGNKIINLNKLIVSINGQATLLFVFLLIPIIFFIPAIALDLSSYQATKVQLQNALEVSADSALNKSIVDNYRSDKIIKLKDMDTYRTNLEKGIQDNFRATINSANNTQIVFQPGYDFTPQPATLTIAYNQQQENSSSAGNEGSVGVNIQLTLTTKLRLPVASKLLSLVGIDDGSGWSPSITITDYVYGIRVLKADDFTTHQWQTYQAQ